MRSAARAGFLAIALIIAACASHQAELRTALTTLNSARDGFTAWDSEHQAEIVRQATSLDEGKAALADYRRKREPVIDGFGIAYKALATATLAPTVDNLGALVADMATLAIAVKNLGADWPKAGT